MSLDEVDAALMATYDDLMAMLAKEVTCVGCRRSVESLVHQVCTYIIKASNGGRG
jgi:hypothetical protein